VASLLGVAVVLGATPVLSTLPPVIGANALLWLSFAAAGPVLTLLVVADVPEDRWSTEIAALNKYQGYGWASGLLLGTVWSATVGRLVGPTTSQRYLFVACASRLPSPRSSSIGRCPPPRSGRPGG
jgi:hypothetical protein